MLVALDYSLSKPRQIVIAGEHGSAATQELLREVHRHFLPNRILLLADGDPFLVEKLKALRGMKRLDDKTTAYVCENFSCQAPVNDPAALRTLLRAG